MDQQQSFRSTLVEWMKELVPFNNFDAYVRMTRETFNANSTKREDNSVTYIFCTDTHTFNVYAHPDYLGAGASSRKVRAGEDWTRGSDLPDGKFCRETWDRIKEAIIRYELVKLDIRPSAPVPDTPSLRMEGHATDLIWGMVHADKAGKDVIGLRVDCGDAGTLMLSKSQAHEVIATLNDLLGKLQAERKPSCGNPACRVENQGCPEKGTDDFVTVHHLQCPKRGPGWA